MCLNQSLFRCRERPPLSALSRFLSPRRTFLLLFCSLTSLFCKCYMVSKANTLFQTGLCHVSLISPCLAILPCQLERIFLTFPHRKENMGFQKEYRCPLLFKSLLYTTSLLPTLVPVFTNGKKSEEDFSCYENKEKSRNSIRCLFCGRLLEATRTPSSESSPAKLLPREPHSASLCQAITTLHCVWEHLCFTSVYFVYLLARCVLR